ncbi:hypothetical protein [Rhizobium bangladeshense]|uniref:hypothetical protein n=1 Tax=Rhizobium bangladeshense TaxID=1138189 RepID=UPI001A98241A|nr:hypothetical protein [Rhizobium bangladeshense]MBX4898487.1 hypothetical protein [Rhizobium bangladeshense]MBX4902878.1 hypothetical protein [Rhizobium bangladeshense]MBX4914660.1 hypothetical protein [Rhizobium bangladeshense]MBY3616511.1 hypothetical protein [Rhizobium bangladeshense]QSY94936.1 hypothetical protein J2J97_03065 [Rhizobium bangladeshense]
MTRRLPRDIPPMRHRVKVRQTPVVRPYWLIVATAIINFGLCALALVLVGGTPTQYVILSALAVSACAVMAARRRRAREKSRPAADYLLSSTATALTMLQWCYTAIVTLGSLSGSQSIILRSID